MPRARRRRGDTQPVKAAPGQPYGERKRQEDAQRAQPLPDDAARFARALEAAQQMSTQGGLRDPAQRPDLPVTAGLPVGAGPGPEALPAPQPGVPAPGAMALAKFLPALELQAADPGSSAQFRQFVRRLRGSMPANLNVADLFGEEGLTPDGDA